MTGAASLSRIAVTLSPRGRETEGRARVVAYLSERSVEPTGGGLATLSFVATPEAVARAFGTDPGADAAAVRTADAVGGGRSATGPDLPVPAALAPFVEAVSVMPAARGFGRRV